MAVELMRLHPTELHLKHTRGEERERERELTQFSIDTQNTEMGEVERVTGMIYRRMTLTVVYCFASLVRHLLSS